MEPAPFNNFISNFSVADTEQKNEVNRQSTVAQLLAENNEINPSHFGVASQVATVMHAV